MLTIGLTGGIASGKSAASNYLASLGIPIIDADAISHRLTAPQSPLLDAIRTEFGHTFFTPDGQLDRKALARHIFSDSKAKKRLEAILHPAIRTHMLEQLAKTTGPYAVLVIPLLAETQGWEFLDRILLIDTPESIQLQRLMQRDSLDLEAAKLRLANQASRAQRQALAHDIIVNDRDLSHLHEQLAQKHQYYLSLANITP